MKIITIVGDSLSMVRPWIGIQYKDTYPFILQELLGNNYHVTVFSERANTVLRVAEDLKCGEGMAYSEPDLIILHLGIVDCAPRLFGPNEQKIVNYLSNSRIFKKPISLLIKFKSKHRMFFTKNFPKTYVSEKKYKEKMEFIIKHIKAKTDSKIFIVNIADTTDFNKSRSYNYEKQINDYNNILEDLVKDNKNLCTLINFNEITKHKNRKAKFMLSDGVHLSKDGHKILSKLLYQEIKNSSMFYQEVRNTPFIDSIDPIENAVNVSSNKFIKITFNMDVKEGPKDIELKDNIGTDVLFDKNIKGNLLTITPKNNLEESNYTLRLHKGCVIDLAGNQLAKQDYKFSVGTSPMVTKIDPANNVKNVPTNKEIKISFSKPIKNGTGWIELTKDNGFVVPIKTKINGNVLIINHALPLSKGMEYTIFLDTGSVTDLAGNPLKLYDSKFITENKPPVVIAIDPIYNEKNVSINKKIKITFNETVKFGIGPIELKNSNGDIININTSIYGKILTITHDHPLEKGINYVIYLEAGSIIDTDRENPIAAYESIFTTSK